jgi:uncharacterized SAM-binding protein YcdF (DUF218 family)
VVRRPLALKLLIVCLAVVIAAAATHPLWLGWIGQALVRDEGPAKADVAVALAGDYWGLRVQRAAELVKAGYVPAVLVSGPPQFGLHESDLVIAMMVREGYPAAWFINFPNESLSTTEEARCILGELRKRGVHKFLLVTSTYHTARAARTWREIERSMGGGPDFRVVAARDKFFTPNDWWRNREGQKTVIIEWMKTIAQALGK